MLRFPPMATVVAALALALPVTAQNPVDTTDALTPGRRALAFAVPFGGTMGFGQWRVVAPDRARGIFLNLTAHARKQSGYTNQPGSEVRDIGISATIGPHVRRYLARSAPVLPFVESAVEVGAAYSSTKDMEADNFQIYPAQGSHEWSALGLVRSGIGAEWFPLRRVSVCGLVGFQLNGSVGRHSFEPGSTTTWSLNLNTVSPGLFLQLYF